LALAPSRVSSSLPAPSAFQVLVDLPKPTTMVSMRWRESIQGVGPPRRRRTGPAELRCKCHDQLASLSPPSSCRSRNHLPRTRVRRPFACPASAALTSASSSDGHGVYGGWRGLHAARCAALLQRLAACSRKREWLSRPCGCVGTDVKCTHAERAVAHDLAHSLLMTRSSSLLA
jgi:hypothetical protein